MKKRIRYIACMLAICMMMSVFMSATTMPISAADATGTRGCVVSDSAITFDAIGGQYAVTLPESFRTCQITNKPVWITVGIKSGTLMITAAENPTFAQRAGTVTLKSGSLSRSFSVTQKEDWIVLSGYPRNQLPTCATCFTMDVKTKRTDWTVMTDQSWARAYKAGNAGDKIQVECSQNSKRADRSATITVKAGNLVKTLVFTQMGVLRPDPASKTVGPKAAYFMISAYDSPNWSVKSNQSWLRVYKNAAYVSVYVDENGKNTNRKGTITISVGNRSATCTVTQKGNSLSADPARVDLKAEKGERKTVSVLCGIDRFSVVGNYPSWLKLTQSDGQVIAETAEENLTGKDRSCTVTLKSGSDAAGWTTTVFTVTQKKHTFVLDSARKTVEYTKSTFQIKVTTIYKKWEVRTSENWIRASKVNDTTVSVTVDPNTNSSERYAFVTVFSGAEEPISNYCMVTQKKAPVYSITWNIDGKKTTSTVASGAKIDKPANPVKSGYIFTGWTPAVPAVMPEKNMTFNAVFKIDTEKRINDILRVAEGEVGYRAAKDDRNNNKYDNGSAWCMAFVSWCARRAGIPESVIPNTNRCTVAYNTLMANGATEHRSQSYKPQPGDLMFFQNFDHVALVVKNNGSTVTVIEGNLLIKRYGTSCVYKWNRNIWGATNGSSVKPMVYVTPNYALEK